MSGKIERLQARYVRALNRHDAKAWALLFAEDGVLMPPNAPASVGREKILAWTTAFLNTYRVHVSVVSKGFIGERAFAHEWGSYTMTLTPKSRGAKIQDAGKFVSVYALQTDKSWSFIRHMWNSDKPLALGLDLAHVRPGNEANKKSSAAKKSGKKVARKRRAPKSLAAKKVATLIPPIAPVPTSP